MIGGYYIVLWDSDEDRRWGKEEDWNAQKRNTDQ